jgi:hypothetical protein
MTTKEWVNNHFDELVKKQFYGKLILQFEAGNVTVLKKEETLKPPKDTNSMDHPRGG